MVFAAIVIISREITVSALREWMAELGARTNVAVSTVGKYKTAFQMIAISVLLNWPPLDTLAYLLLYTAVILTLWSMFIYLKAAWPYLKQPKHVVMSFKMPSNRRHFLLQILCFKNSS